jgi:hypothetical protein
MVYRHTILQDRTYTCYTMMTGWMHSTGQMYLPVVINLGRGKSNSQPLHATQNGVSDTDWPTLVIAQHKHSYRISLISSGRYKVPQERRSGPPTKTPGSGQSRASSCELIECTYNSRSRNSGYLLTSTNSLTRCATRQTNKSHNV